MAVRHYNRSDTDKAVVHETRGAPGRKLSKSTAELRGSATPQAGQLPPIRHADRSAGAYCPNLLDSRKFGIL